jgi:serine/threonine-protein kinase
MEADRWQRLKESFWACLELPPAEREAFLDRECAGDAELRAEVISLLVAHQRAEAGNDALPSPALGGRVGVGVSSMPRLDSPYRMVREIGRGGTGVVYLAERSDGQFEMNVAIKLMRPEMSSRRMAERLSEERQTLAALDHPNIARLLDGGATEDGAPYLVMEHVEGVAIDEYCDAHRLTTRQRLDLFLEVCRAVQHAHRSLVLHRDLKPRNILVTVDGAVKLLDFGIAKLLPSADPGGDLRATATAERALTPAYASPEQVRGEPLTTASDVYSLGVVLYELLTGHHPLGGEQTSPLELMQSLCELDPATPSAVVTRAVETTDEEGRRFVAASPEQVAATREGHPERLRRRLRGDLDRILLKALRKEPGRRYQTVAELADDIGRHLGGLPVLARESSVAYRIAKFVRRHRAGTAATAAVLASLVVAVVVTSHQASVAARERDRAQAEAEKAVMVTSFLQQVLESADPEADVHDRSLSELLERASGDAGRLSAHPQVEAAVRTTIGKAYRGLGRYREAEAQLESALALTRSQQDAQPAAIGRLLTELAIVLHDAGEAEAAEARYREALPVLVGASEEPTLESAEAWNGYAVLLRRTGRLAAAEAFQRRALAAYRLLLGETSDKVAMGLNNLAVLLESQSRPEEAEATYREALEVVRAVRGESHPDVAWCLHNLAGVLASQGRPGEAESLYREALAIRQEILGDDHPLTARCLVELADAVRVEGRLEEAESLARAGRAIEDEILEPQHPLRSRSLLVLGWILLEQSRPGEAEARLRETLAIRLASLPPEHWLVASAESLLGRCLAARGRHDEAERLLLHAFESLSSSRGSDHEWTVRTAAFLADHYRAVGREAEAERYLP